MRAQDIVFALVIVALWYLSAFYIAAPHEVHNLLLGGLGMTHEQHHILGIGLFIISLMVVILWVAMSIDESDMKVSESTTSSQSLEASTRVAK